MSPTSARVSYVFACPLFLSCSHHTASQVAAMNIPSSWPSGVEARKFLLEKKVMSVVESGLGKLLVERPEGCCGWLAQWVRECRRGKERELQGSDGSLLRAWECDAGADPAPRFRRADDAYIWGCGVVGVQRWKALKTHITSEHPSIRSLVVINVSASPITFLEGTPYHGEPHQRHVFPDTVRSTLASVGQAHAAYYDLPLPASSVCPQLVVFDEVTAIAQTHYHGLAAGSTGVVVISADGKDDVTCGMALLATVLTQMERVKRLAVRRREWKESLRDKEVRKHEVSTLIEKLYEEGKAADEKYIQEQVGLLEGAEPEQQERLDFAQRIRNERERQWDRYQVYIRSQASTKIAAAYRGHMDRKKAKSQKMVKAKSQKRALKNLNVQETREKEEDTKGRGLGWHTEVDPFAELKELSTFKAASEYINSTAEGELFTYQDQPKPRHVITRSVLKPAQDIHCAELFTVELVEETEEGCLDDYSIPLTAFVATIQACGHRDLLLEIHNCRKRYKTVPSVQCRVLRTLELVVVGTCFAAWVAMREAAVSQSIADAFCVDPSSVASAQQTFKNWFEGTPLFDALRNHHMSMLLATRAASVLKDRALIKSGIVRGAVRAPSIRGQQRSKAHSVKVVQRKSVRTLVPPGEDAQRAFKKVHRKLPLFSVPDPLSPEDTSDVMGHMLPSVRSIIWFSLTPALTVQVGPHTLSAPLSTPAMFPSSMSANTVNIFQVIEPKAPEPVAAKKQKSRLKSKALNGSPHIDPTKRIQTPPPVPEARDPDEIPIMGHLWTAKERCLENELKQSISKTGEVTFYEGAKGSRRNLMEVTQTVLQLEKEEVEQPVASSPKEKKEERPHGSSKVGVGLQFGLANLGTPEVGRKGSPSITSVTLGGSAASRKGGSECNESFAGSIPDSVVQIEEVDRLPTNVDEVVVPCGEGIVAAAKKDGLAVRFVRQPLLEGVSEDTYHTFDRIVKELEAGFSVFQENEVAVVVGHSEELNPFLLAVVTVVFSMLSKKYYGEDSIDLLVKARRQSEMVHKQRVSMVAPHTPSEPEEHEEQQPGNTTPRSVISTGESTTLTSVSGEEVSEGSLSATSDTDDTVEGFTLTQQLLKKPSAGSPFRKESLSPAFIPVSPFHCIDHLAKSTLGTSLCVDESITYLDTLFEHTNKSLEEGVIGRIPATLQEIKTCPPAELLLLSRELASWLESYTLLLFFTSWMKTYIEAERPDTIPHPSFAAWMMNVHPEAHNWLRNFNPWGEQGAPRGIDPNLTTARYRWAKQSLPSEVI
eukprot:TRINITY_DN740_c0_g1_i5.p1 TRINITY_DN740_c0_g1~~TRINITY_DN740_c0_g1_i5.p1  ORF type:complete len:1276 (+),score=406.41 TRINITY_DN740_c0_g1_i5:1767-5594(+)